MSLLAIGCLVVGVIVWCVAGYFYNRRSPISGNRNRNIALSATLSGSILGSVGMAYAMRDAKDSEFIIAVFIYAAIVMLSAFVGKMAALGRNRQY